MSSIFTKIIQREIPAYIVGEDEHHIAFLDIAPVVKGHVLVVPKREVVHWTELPASLLASLMQFGQRVACALEQVVACKRVALSILGLEVPHVHIHLLPIEQEEDANLQGSRINLTPQEMQQLAESIQVALTKQPKH